MTWDEKALRLALAPRPPRRVTKDTPYPIYIRYIGTDAIAALGISTDGNFIFYSGATLGTVTMDADTNLGSGGIIDVSQAKWNTYGEVAAQINTSDNWRAWLKDCLEGDATTVGMTENHTYTADDSLLLQSPAGFPCIPDTSLVKSLTICICVDSDMTNVLDGNNDPVDNDSKNQAINKCVDAQAVIPSSTGSGFIYLYDGQDATATCWQYKSSSVSAVQTLDPPSAVQSSVGNKLIVRNHMGSSSGDNGWLQVMPESETGYQV